LLGRAPLPLRIVTEYAELTEVRFRHSASNGTRADGIPPCHHNSTVSVLVDSILPVLQSLWSVGDVLIGCRELFAWGRS
jgi:hypothetical protein